MQRVTYVGNQPMPIPLAIARAWALLTFVVNATAGMRAIVGAIS